MPESLTYSANLTDKEYLILGKITAHFPFFETLLGDLIAGLLQMNLKAKWYLVYPTDIRPKIEWLERLADEKYENADLGPTLKAIAIDMRNINQRRTAVTHGIPIYKTPEFKKSDRITLRLRGKKTTWPGVDEKFLSTLLADMERTHRQLLQLCLDRGYVTVLPIQQ